ncbi:MAG: GNAT family N-acetyltransferase, partial [Phyllobacterium sp.]
MMFQSSWEIFEGPVDMKFSGFDSHPELTGNTLQLRPLRQADYSNLFAAASKPEIWAGHPAKDRYKPEVFEPYFQFLLKNGGTLVAIDQQSEQIIGCSRYYASPDQADSIAIGFTFLDSDYWGGTTNFEFKQLMLDHALKSFPEVWFHIDPTNIRSQKATAKLGATPVYDAT